MVRIDRTAPVTSSDATSTWQHGPVTVHLSSTDAGVGGTTTYYSLDGSAPSLVATSAIIISAEGTTTLKYKSVDALGNTESLQSIPIRIDNTKPTTGDNASPGWVKAPASISLTASDPLSGIAATYYSLDGSSPSLVATGPITIATDGTTTLKYYSRDSVGNTETVLHRSRPQTRRASICTTPRRLRTRRSRSRRLTRNLVLRTPSGV
jgi:hypothetical protein